MSQLSITAAQASDMTNYVEDITVAAKNTDGTSEQDETKWINSKWSKYWGYFNEIGDLKSAILMKATWNVGKGYEADPETKVILEHISGWGKDTFDDILFNMDAARNIGGDSFAEIIRDKESGTLLNLKPLDPGSINIIVDRKGIIKRYEQVSKTGIKGSVLQKFQPEEIFHLSCDRLADQIHGISKIEGMENTILAENESFKDMKKIMHWQARPFILWKLKTDDPVKIAEVVRKIDNARNLGEDMFIPDDDDAIEYEIVQLNPSAIIFQWRNDIQNKFYRAMGLPLIIFGQAGSTESGGKIEYLAHEQIFEKDQRYLEKQIWSQLGLKINLIPPVSLLENLQTDEAKDAGAMAGMQIKPSELTAGMAG